MGMFSAFMNFLSGVRPRHVVEQGTFVRGIDMNRRTSDGRLTPHWGIDIGAPEGTPVYAVTDGTVILSRPVRGYGNVVMLRHDDGRTSSLYAHLSQSLVAEGQHVAAQDAIARTGTTSIGQQVTFDAQGVPTSSGEMSGGAVGARVGPHLHMEIHPVPIPNMAPNFRRLDPVAWLQTNGIQQYAARWNPRAPVDMPVA
jgi:murein DD-endopeptidase MepM/ murein hydrolase activator NlpD